MSWYKKFLHYLKTNPGLGFIWAFIFLIIICIFLLILSVNSKDLERIVQPFNRFPLRCIVFPCVKITSVKWGKIAEWMVNWAYLFLVIGIVIELVRFLKERKD